MGKKLGVFLIVSFSFIILLMAVIIGISIRGMNLIEKQTNKIIVETMPINEACNNILTALVDEETAIRGYLITRNVEFLKPYNLGKKKISDGIATIKSHLNNNVQISNLLREGTYETDLIQLYYESEISLIRNGKIAEATYGISTGKSKMDAFRGTFNKIDDEVKKYTYQVKTDADTTKHNVIDILLGASIIVFLMTIAIIAMILQIISEDITQRKELNKSLEKIIKEQEEFFANISHELKTPLNVILSTIQLLDMYNKNGKLTENKDGLDRYIKIMKQNCFRLSKLTTNLIDMSKIEAGYVELNLKNQDIVSVVEDITLSVVEYGENKGINLIFDTEVEEKFMAFDADKIERIMLNLLSNAFKFTNPGDHVEVNIKDKGENIIISVRDTGIGIPEDKLELIFERFKQVDKSFTRNTEGSGIGLSLVKSLVEMHGGSISVDSRQGYGSEFTIELPVKIIDEKEILSEKSLDRNNQERVNIEFSDIYL